jgi:hypothetical protein
MPQKASAIQLGTTIRHVVLPAALFADDSAGLRGDVTAAFRGDATAG